ncbi:hypothetical protein IQ06DRAFT_148710 [Phaeosphaeriaceae sp. SRC1lsM3a]|nr:hypothetical protein IQ06DRAFT_148710 [Stagonospora sp. SRC1lsM3a]
MPRFLPPSEGVSVALWGRSLKEYPLSFVCRRLIIFGSFDGSLWSVVLGAGCGVACSFDFSKIALMHQQKMRAAASRPSPSCGDGSRRCSISKWHSACRTFDDVPFFRKFESTSTRALSLPVLLSISSLQETYSMSS